MTIYRVIVEDTDVRFNHAFDGEPQINLTFQEDGIAYRVITRAHDEDTDTPTIHARII